MHKKLDKLEISPVKYTLLYTFIENDSYSSEELELLLKYDIVGVVQKHVQSQNSLQRIFNFFKSKGYFVFGKKGCVLLAVKERKKLKYENRESQQCVKVQRIQLENETNDVEQICLRVTYPTDQIVTFLLTNFSEERKELWKIYESNIQKLLKTKTRTNYFEPVVFGKFPDSYPTNWQQVDVHMIPTASNEFIDFLSLNCRLIQINHVNCSSCNYIFVDNDFCNCNDVVENEEVFGRKSVSVEMDFVI